MKRLVIATCLSAMILQSVNAQSCPAEQEKWLMAALIDIHTVKIGMTREDFLKLFARPAGFFTSTGHTGTYVYKACPLIRIDVEFKLVSEGQGTIVESSNDIIKSVSRPYLAEPQYD